MQHLTETPRTICANLAAAEEIKAVLNVLNVLKVIQLGKEAKVLHDHEETDATKASCNR